MPPRYRRLPAIALLALLAPWAAAAETHDGGPSDSRIHFSGRWDRSDPASARSCWSAAYLRLAFTGTTLEARCTGEVEAIVDGAQVACPRGPDTVDLTPVPL